MRSLHLDLNKVEEKVLKFVKEEVKKAGVSKVVLGLSGGIDSGLVAYIAAKALGAENVFGIMLPYKSSSKESIEHGELVANKIGIKTKIIEITHMVEPYFNMEPDMSNLRKGNKMARERMSVLFDYSAKEKAIVIGTSNKTEIYLGYGTLYGDTACGINPIGNLYKTNVWALAKHLGVPPELIEKRPTADLWEGQTDEDDLGFTYLEADKILYELVDEKSTEEEVVSKGFKRETVEEISNRIKNSAYKRRLPLIAEIK
ncbi:MAG: NAD+ synthase [Fusobacteriaceae bacterium]